MKTKNKVSENVATPNDLKLSDRRGWRDRCVAGGKAAAEAAGVTAAPVRCSARLGVSVRLGTFEAWNDLGGASTLDLDVSNCCTKFPVVVILMRNGFRNVSDTVRDARKRCPKVCGAVRHVGNACPKVSRAVRDVGNASLNIPGSVRGARDDCSNMLGAIRDVASGRANPPAASRETRTGDPKAPRASPGVENHD